MATSGRGSGVVGYNVQVAVDTEHHLIVTHEVTNTGSDRSQLAKVASQAKDILGADHLDAVADRGYFNSTEILACEQAGHYGDAAEADDIGREVGWPLRQAGLRLSVGYSTRDHIIEPPTTSRDCADQARPALELLRPDVASRCVVRKQDLARSLGGRSLYFRKAIKPILAGMPKRQGIHLSDEELGMEVHGFHGVESASSIIGREAQSMVESALSRSMN
jgi:hypothetical protein